MCPQLRPWSRSIVLLVIITIAATAVVPAASQAARPQFTDDYRTTGDPLGGEKARDEYPAGGGEYHVTRSPAGEQTATVPSGRPTPAWLTLIVVWSLGSWSLVCPLLRLEARS